MGMTDDDWQYQLLSIAEQLTLGFSFTDTSDDSQVFADMSGRLDQIENTLGVLDNKIDTVISLLEQLPQEISGIVDYAFTKQWMISAMSDAGALRDKTRDFATYTANKTAVDAMTTDLEKSIAEIWAFSNSGALHATHIPV